MRKSLIISCAIALSLVLAGCAGTGPRADSSGPLVYVTKGVTRVVNGEQQGQVACERTKRNGSHIKVTYCMTAAEVVQRHNADADYLHHWGSHCPEPSLCMH